MITMRRARPVTEADEAPDYWITYSDLMVSLLMAFALLLFLALGRIQSGVRDAENTVKGLKSAINSAAAALRQSRDLVSVDTVTGTLTMNSAVLFAYGSAELKPEAMAPITQIATRLIPALLAAPAVDTMIQEITVEGHTDTVGTYMSNLQLSQQRAYSVMKAMVESTYGTPKAARIRTLIVASGKSEVRPIYTEGHVDAVKSRRIEIHIRLRNDAILKQVLKAASASAAPRGKRP